MTECLLSAVGLYAGCAFFATILKFAGKR